MRTLLYLVLPALLSAGVNPVFERASAPPPTPLDRLLIAHWQKLKWCRSVRNLPFLSLTA